MLPARVQHLASVCLWLLETRAHPKRHELLVMLSWVRRLVAPVDDLSLTSRYRYSLVMNYLLWALFLPRWGCIVLCLTRPLKDDPGFRVSPMAGLHELDFGLCVPRLVVAARAMGGVPVRHHSRRHLAVLLQEGLLPVLFDCFYRRRGVRFSGGYPLVSGRDRRAPTTAGEVAVWLVGAASLMMTVVPPFAGPCVTDRVVYHRPCAKSVCSVY